MFGIKPLPLLDFLALCEVPDSIVDDLASQAFLDNGYVSACLRKVANVLGVDEREVGVAYGRHFISHGEMEVDAVEVFHLCSRSLPEMMVQLNSLVTYFCSANGTVNACDRAPEVWVKKATPGRFDVHCKVEDPMQVYWIEGIVNELAYLYFNQLSLVINTRKLSGDGAFQVLEVTAQADQLNPSDFCCHQQVVKSHAEESVYSMDAPTFYQLFPYHLLVDGNGKVLQAGSVIRRLYPALAESGVCHIAEFFQVQHPVVSDTHLDQILDCEMGTAVVLVSSQGLLLKGSWTRTKPGAVCGAAEEGALFVGAPVFQRLADIKRHGMTLSDIPPHSLSLDLTLERETRMRDMQWQEEDIKAVLNEKDSAFRRLHHVLVSSLETNTESCMGMFPKEGSPVANAILLIDKLMMHAEVDKVVPLSQLVSLRRGLMETGCNLGKTTNVSPEEIDMFTGGDEEVKQNLLDLLGAQPKAGTEVEDALSSYRTYLPPIVEHGAESTSPPGARPYTVRKSHDRRSHTAADLGSRRANTDKATPVVAHPVRSNSAWRSLELPLAPENGGTSKDAISSFLKLQTANSSAPGGRLQDLQEDSHSVLDFTCKWTSTSHGQGECEEVQHSMNICTTEKRPGGVKKLMDKVKRAFRTVFSDETGSDGTDDRMSRSLPTSPMSAEFLKQTPSLSENKTETNATPAKDLRISPNSIAHLKLSASEQPMKLNGSEQPRGSSYQNTAEEVVREGRQLREESSATSIGLHSGFYQQACSSTAGSRVSLNLDGGLGGGQSPLTKEHSYPWFHPGSTQLGGPVMSGSQKMSQHRSLVSLESRASPCNLSAVTKPRNLQRFPSEELLGLVSEGSSVMFRKARRGSCVTFSGVEEVPDHGGRVSTGIKMESWGVGPASPSIHMLKLLKEPPNKLASILEKVDDWTFDMFELQRATSGRTLSCLAFHLFQRSEITTRFNLDERKLGSFLVKVEDGYPPHPYHCREHAADVLRTLHVIATRGGLIRAASPLHLDTKDLIRTLSQSVSDAATPAVDDSQLGPTRDALTLFFLYLAAVIHDLDHRGVNNQFLIQTGDPLALLYNDVSPMENHHVAAAFSLLREDKYNFMSSLPKKVLTVLRAQVIELVLATDMKQHFSLVSSVQSKTSLMQVAKRPQAPSPDVPRAPSNPGSPSMLLSAPQSDGFLRVNSHRDLKSRTFIYQHSQQANTSREIQLQTGPIMSPNGVSERSAQTVAMSRSRSSEGLKKMGQMASATNGVEMGGSEASRGSRLCNTLNPASASQALRTSRTNMESLEQLPTSSVLTNLVHTGSRPPSRSSSKIGSLLMQSCSNTTLEQMNSESLALNTGTISAGPTPPVTGSLMFDAGIRASLQSLRIMPNITRPSPDKIESSSSSLLTRAPEASPQINPAMDPEFMSLIWKIALKCADLSNLANSRPVARKWVLLLEEEMFRQGDKERAAGLPISPLMDRAKAGVTKSQPGFFNVVALPLFKSLTHCFPSAMPLLDGAKDNLAMWLEAEKKIVAEGSEGDN